MRSSEVFQIVTVVYVLEHADGHMQVVWASAHCDIGFLCWLRKRDAWCWATSGILLLWLRRPPPFLIPEPIPADTSTPWSEAHVAALFSTLSEIRRFVVMLEHGPSLLTV